jgi:hypothetical protein
VLLLLVVSGIDLAVNLQVPGSSPGRGANNHAVFAGLSCFQFQFGVTPGLHPPHIQRLPMPDLEAKKAWSSLPGGKIVSLSIRRSCTTGKVEEYLRCKKSCST